MYNYKKIKLKNGKTIDEHRLIVQQSIGRTLSKNECVHHKNGNTKDNRLENLEIISRQKHGSLHYKPHRCTAKTRQKLSEIFSGEKHPQAKLNLEKVKKIKEMIVNGIGVCAIGRLFGLSSTIISQIKMGKRWNSP